MFKSSTVGPSTPVRLCSCGNADTHEGFYTCDDEGHVAKSSDLICCQRCGKIVDRVTGEFAGYRSSVLPEISD
jgi:hypothetical protein